MMEAPLQQRIVGAIVLVTLGVIFIPALLDGSGYKARQVQDIRVKEKPRLPPLSQKTVAAVETPLDKIEDKQQKALASDPNKPDEKKPIKSFALQTGTFDTYENAEVLRDKLRKAGYTTFIHKSTAKGKTSYKVRIGPDVDYDALDKVKAKLKKTHKIDGYIVNYP
jgi:DedD protein